MAYLHIRISPLLSREANVCRLLDLRRQIHVRFCLQDRYSGGGGDLGRDYQHRERLGNDDDNTDTRAHFLRILSMAFPLASSSTSLSR